MKLGMAALVFVLAYTPAIAQQNVPAPKVDHHQHLLSPLAAKLTSPVAPAVAVPPDLAQVLDRRAAHWNDKAKLAPMYAADAFIVTTIDRNAVHGGGAVAAYVSTRFRAAYRMRPIAFNRSDAFAHIAGYFERGEGDAARPFGYFNLSLVKDGAGWRIASEMFAFPGPAEPEPQTAKDLIAALDEAGIQKAVVLSDGYFFDSPRLTPNGGSYENVRAINDWTAEQVAQYPDRLVAFCSLNPLSDYALTELRRCAASGKFRGLKLHFGVSGVDLMNRAHVAKVRAVVAEANRLKLPLIVHVRADGTYGAAHARVLIDRIVSAAPDVVFQIAHFWGGEGYSADALEVYARAVKARDPRTKNLFFDIAQMALVAGNSPDDMKVLAQRMREVGLDRILYATDGPLTDGTPRDGWAATRGTLPLTDAEFRILANNVAPYLR
jgi:uncharacterized protein